MNRTPLRIGQSTSLVGLDRELARIQAAEAERLRALSNPWDVLAHARRYDDLHGRAPAYPKFIALAASWPAADLDMMLAEARRTFRVRISVMRADVRTAQAQCQQREPAA